MIKQHFNIDTLEERLVLYRYLKYRYTTRLHQIVLPYKIKVTNPYELGLCFYLKYKTTVSFQDLPEMVEVYNSKHVKGSLIGPAGNLQIRINFLNEVIKLTKSKIRYEKCNHK